MARESSDSGQGATPPTVRLQDARSLRAFAHPLRVALLSALRINGPLTATQAASIVDDSPSNCSFHLRTLASFGIIESIPGADRRQRLWQTVKGGVSLEPSDNAESRIAARAAFEVFHAQAFRELTDWLDRESDAPQEWRDAWFDSTAHIAVTAEELTAISERIAEVVRPYVERRRSRPNGPGEAVVLLTALGYPQRMPIEPPESQVTQTNEKSDLDAGRTKVNKAAAPKKSTRK